jgi:flagellin
MNLLDGTYSDKKFHIGANEEQNTTIAIANMKADSLGVTLAAEDAVAATGTIQGVTITASTAGAAEDVIVEVVQASGNSKPTSATVASGKLTITLGTDASGKALAVTNSSIVEVTVSGYTLALASGAVGSGAFTVAGGGGTITGGADAVVADVNKGINVSTQKSADSAITTVNTAISTVSSERSKLGAMQNRLEHTIKNLDTSAENLQASESRIRDVDMAKEMMEQTKQNILQQAATAMLAQSNQLPATVLQLLR